MAADPSIACNLATSWYAFTYSLSWSNQCEVAQVLSDIPFVSVGVLVFGVSTLFPVMKRVSLSAVWLFFSVLLAFVAAVLDLGQTLADGISMNTPLKASEPIISAREILFALSIGFRFLFYWSYVAEPPRKRLPATSAQRFQKFKFLTLEFTREPHSGSWTRWGLPGKLLGVGLLIAVIVITALQIVWRVAPQFHQYSNVYGADAALELLVSFLLLLRLLSNTLAFNSSDSISVHSLRECLAPISGLLINIAIGVGSLLCFAFTESTVGRLLQAFEIYLVAVSVTVIAILRHRAILLSATSTQDRKCKDVVFTLPEPARGSTFRITPPFVETPRLSVIFGTATQNKYSSREALRRSARRSLNHVSSWVSSRISRNRTCYDGEEVRLWDAEKIKVDPPYTGSIDTELQASVVSLAQEPRERAEHFWDISTGRMSIVSALDAQSEIMRSMEGSAHSDRILRPRANILQRTILPQVRTSSVPVPSPTSSEVKRAGCIVATSEASPVYGLGGIQPPTTASDSRTSIDELLRQQSQLDRSIEALKLFSARTSASLSHSNSATEHGSAELSRSPSAGQRTVSSDVSLSSFPVPPWLTAPVPSLPPSHASSIKRIRGSRRVRLVAAQPTPIQDTRASVPPTTSVSLVDMPSFPRSPLGEDNESLSAEGGKSSRSDSGGTQYNVTSFIGDLATPSEPRQGSQEKPWWPTEGKSSVGSVIASSCMTPRMPRVPRRPEGLPASPAATKPSLLAHSLGLSQKDTIDEPVNDTRYRTTEQVTPVIVPPAEPRLETESCMTVLPTEGTGRAQRIFVRPRPPPLAIQPYREQSSMARVEVMVDD